MFNCAFDQRTVDPRIYLFIRQQPVQEFPSYAREVCAGLNGLSESARPNDCFVVRKALEDAILKSPNHLPAGTIYFIVDFVIFVIDTRKAPNLPPAFKRAAHGAALAIPPIPALDDLVGLGVRRDDGEHLILDFMAVLVCGLHVYSSLFGVLAGGLGENGALLRRALSEAFHAGCGLLQRFQKVRVDGLGGVLRLRTV